MRKIRAFIGVEGSGKGYSCQRLLMTKGFAKLSFADCLRDIAFNTLGFSFEDGMKRYEELKQTKLINDLNFRNILENLGSAVRKYDRDFWARSLLTKIDTIPKNICIDDLRYPNEYRILKEYSQRNMIDFKVVFTDYHSERYKDNNPHESAALANYLKVLGYEDQEYVDEADIFNFELLQETKKWGIIDNERIDVL